MAKKDITYEQAFNELEDILDKIENHELKMDDLSLAIKRATELVKVCKTKLRNTEEDVEKILESLDD
ncbi:MAG: exodeoxyribonuclease VII small subunit [Bacteroidales bacterium]|nr:exodeoxyribonuclease VII small subunit [Bacteroidales bacterium]